MKHSQNQKSLRPKIVMVVDAWFPIGSIGKGKYGSTQVHVREIRERLQQRYNLEVELLYPTHRSIMYRLVWPVIVLLQLCEYLRQNKVDIIHVHGLGAGIIGKIASLIKRKPIILTVHTTANIDNRKNQLMSWLETKVYLKTKYDKQISVSQNFEKYPNVNVPIIIPNGVDVDDFDQVEVEKNEKPTLIWVGSNSRHKGLDVLKKAIKRVRHTVPNLYVQLVTGGELTGIEVIKAFKQAHMFVLPSLAEGLSISLLEAWAAKLPVIATKVGDNKTLIEDGVNGILVEPDNVNQLTEAILKVFRMRTKDQQMGLNGYELVKNNYSWDSAAQKTYQLYLELLDTI